MSSPQHGEMVPPTSEAAPPLLTILIPTYNRARYLRQNLQLLCSDISRNQLDREISILVSDNSSPDDTVAAVTEVQGQWPCVTLELVKQSENIGSVRNVLFLLGAATTEYVLYVGDDDYIAEGFLLELMALIRERQVTLVVPSNLAISVEGEPTGFGRDIDVPARRMEAGFMSCLYFSWRGHQMSGLMFKRPGLMELCQQHRIENMYLFVYLVAVSTLRGPAVHMTTYPVKVSTPAQQAKGWSYGNDGLLGDVFINFAALKGIGLVGRCMLEMKFLWVQYWRYAMYLKLGLPAFIRCLWNIIAGRATSPFTRVLFPLSLPLLLPLKAVMLAVKGELRATLKRKVDI